MGMIIGIFLIMVCFLYIMFIIKAARDLSIIDRYSGLKSEVVQFIIFSSLLLLILIFLAISFIKGY